MRIEVHSPAEIRMLVSVPERFYQLQFTDTLADGSWQDLGAPVSGTGDVLTFEDTTGDLVTRRFYRVVVDP